MNETLTEPVAPAAAPLKLPAAIPHAVVAVVVAAACLLYALDPAPLPVRSPGVLIVAAVLLWLRPRGRTAATLQMVLGVYLCCVPISAIMHSAVSLNLAGMRINISCGALVVCALVLAGGVGWALQSSPEQTRIRPRGWAPAAAIIAAHMAVLYWLLHAFYGYGYDRSPAVLGQLALFALAVMTLPQTLQKVAFRRLIAAALIASFTAIAIANG